VAQQEAQGPPSVLVVEDEPSLRELIRSYLELAGIQVQTAASAEEAIARSREQRPTLVVLDMMMATVGGVTVGTWLRATYGQELPIVVISASRLFATNGADAVQAFASMVKPFDFDQLVTTVQQGCAARPEAQAPAAAP